MATIHSQQLARKLFPKLDCSALLAILICATVLLSEAIYQSLITLYDKLVPKNFLNILFATGRNKRLQATVLASLLGQGSKTVAKRSIPKWKPYRKERRFSKNSWSKHWPKLNKTSRRIKIWQSGSPDHPGPSKQSRNWRLPLQLLHLSDQLQNTKLLNMPPETSAGNTLLLYIRCRSRTYCSTMSKLAKKRTKCCVRKSPKLFHRTYNWPNKPPTYTKLP